MIAFVTGATGYTGREVVKELVEKEIKTYAHIRPNSPHLKKWSDYFKELGAFVDTTPWNEQKLEETLEKIKPTHLFCLIGTTLKKMKEEKRKSPSQQISYESIDYGLTVLLLHAAKKITPSPLFVYLSASSVNQKSVTPYSRVRWKTEQAVINSDLAYLIARPSFIIGLDRDDKRTIEYFGAKLSDGLLSVAGFLGAKRIKNRYRSTTNKILAPSLVKWSLDPAIKNRIIESEELRDS